MTSIPPKPVDPQRVPLNQITVARPSPAVQRLMDRADTGRRAQFTSSI